ncbi:MAG: DUF1361 domain-containing protein [Flavisolibacter sp.]
MKLSERNVLFRLYYQQKEEDQMAILSSLFSMALIFFRILYTGRLMFVFLVWNLFLGFIPLALSKCINVKSVAKAGWLFFVVMIIWLLFIPNAFYIITDLFHLNMNSIMPLWFDLVLILSFAWTGMLMGIISVRRMEALFEQHFNRKFDLLFIIPVMVLNATGIYFGRYLRFNSWDVFTNPFVLVGETVDLFVHPLRNRVDWSMICCYSFFLTLVYVTIKRLSGLFAKAVSIEP